MFVSILTQVTIEHRLPETLDHSEHETNHLTLILNEQVPALIWRCTISFTPACNLEHFSRSPLVKWSKHGQTCIYIADSHEPPMDITIFMDVALNPGPSNDNKTTNTDSAGDVDITVMSTVK